MSALITFIDDENFWKKQTNEPLLTIPTNKQECKPLFETLEYNLSPENLHCDGEISNVEANQKYNFLMKVWNILEHIQHERRVVNV